MSSIATLEAAVHGPLNEAGLGVETASETAVAGLVRELFIRAREARRPLYQQWKRNYTTLNNRGYLPNANPWDESPAVATVWPIIASATAWMTDQRPEIQTMPVAEPTNPYTEFYQKIATDMNTAIKATFQSHMLDGEITKALWDVYTYGIGYFKTQWEAHLAEGLGDAVFRRVDPATIYPDPHARSMNELTFIVEAKTMTVADADRAWPGAARKINAGGFAEGAETSPHRLDSTTQPHQSRAALGALAPSTTPFGMGNPSSLKPQDMPTVTVLEAYVRGYLVEPDDTQDGVSKVRDDWRCIVVCGNAVLLDMPCNDINAFGTHPYDRIVLFDAGEWYGPCIVELLTPIQRNLNWLLGSINKNIYLMGNPVLVEDPRSATRNKRFTNRPGQRLEGNLGTVGWMTPPQIHPQMSIQLIQYMKGEAETISGLSAMVRGFAPTGRNAQGVLDSVQDAAFVRVRASMRELERSLRGVGSKISATIAEFYTEDRLMSLIGEDGQHLFLSLRARHFYAIDADDPGARIPLRFTIIADAGSQLPTSRQARASEAKHLFTIGAIDVYELLKTMQWPGFAGVAQRVMEQQAQSAQAAAATG